MRRPCIYPANPFVSVAAGHTYVLRAGEEGEETVIVHVTDETREILGVDCRVVVDVVLESEADGPDVEYDAVEVTDDWFAQDEVSDVYYCGEVSRNGFMTAPGEDEGGDNEAFPCSPDGYLKTLDFAPACEIDDPDALLEVLCAQSPAFCH